DQRTQQPLAARPDVMNELKEPQVQRQTFLGNSPVGAEPRTQQRPEPFERIDMDLAEGPIPKCGHVALVLGCCYVDMFVIFSSSGSLRMRLISQFSRASGARFSETDDSPETVVRRWILPAKLKALLGSSTILSQVVAGKDLMVESKSPLFGIAPSVCKRLLFSVVFLVCHHLFRGTKLVFHLLAVANLSAPLEKDPVVHIESLVDHEDVVQLVLDGDLALMHHVIFADDVNVSLVEDLERRPLGDNECVLERSADQHAAGLAMTEQAVRVRKIRAKGYVPGLVVELGLDRTDFAGLRELVAVRQLEFDFLILVTLLQAGHVFEVLGLGYVEINP